MSMILLVLFLALAGVIAKGYPGYTYSTIAVYLAPAQYLGDGINGWQGGTQYQFAVRERDLENLRPRQETTDGPFQEGVGGSVGKRVQLTGYFKGTLIPNINTAEFIKVVAQIGWTFTGVIMVESFKEIGIVDQALQFQISGTTDGTFTSQ